MPTKIVLGPPGTGKTTTLLNMLDERFKNGLLPERTGFFSFTKKATREARDRAIAKFPHFKEEQFHYFKTLHSLAFEYSGVRNTKKVMGLKEYKAVGAILGVEVEGFNPFEEGGAVFGGQKGDHMFTINNLARSRRISLKDQWKRSNLDDVSWWEMEKFEEVFRDWKKDEGYIDFNEMTELFIERNQVPSLDLIIVDEAQDLSRLQWMQVDCLVQKSRTKELIIAGDDDQMIYEWSGADGRTFKIFEGEVIHLTQSYRVPKKIHDIATYLLKNVHDRRPKTWDPRKEEGDVSYHNTLDELNLGEGTWMMLARNNWSLAKYEEHCREMGYSYETKKKDSPLKTDAFKAIKVWHNLINGKMISIESVKLIYDHMYAGDGYKHGSRNKLEHLDPTEKVDFYTLQNNHGLLVKGEWHEVLGKIRKEDIDYYRSAITRGENLHAKPRIKISTIHGVKGGEAEHVVLMLDMSMRTWTEYMKDPDSEARVWYVAVTRASKSLHIMQPRSTRFYDPLS